MLSGSQFPVLHYLSSFRCIIFQRVVFNYLKRLVDYAVSRTLIIILNTIALIFFFTDNWKLKIIKSCTPRQILRVFTHTKYAVCVDSQESEEKHGCKPNEQKIMCIYIYIRNYDDVPVGCSFSPRLTQ